MRVLRSARRFWCPAPHSPSSIRQAGKIIVPFPAGGVTDIAGRLIAQKLSERLGQQFYIENIAGAGGNLGMAQVARAPGDGYTVLLASSSITVNPSLYSKMSFDIEKTSSRSPRPAARRTPGW